LLLHAGPVHAGLREVFPPQAYFTTEIKPISAVIGPILDHVRLPGVTRIRRPARAVRARFQRRIAVARLKDQPISKAYAGSGNAAA
jgi:hypothetical protein